jgi:hypothetical protein
MTDKILELYQLGMGKIKENFFDLVNEEGFSVDLTISDFEAAIISSM